MSDTLPNPTKTLICFPEKSHTDLMIKRYLTQEEITVNGVHPQKVQQFFNRLDIPQIVNITNIKEYFLKKLLSQGAEEPILDSANN